MSNYAAALILSFLALGVDVWSAVWHDSNWSIVAGLFTILFIRSILKAKDAIK